MYLDTLEFVIYFKLILTDLQDLTILEKEYESKLKLYYRVEVQVQPEPDEVTPIPTPTPQPEPLPDIIDPIDDGDNDIINCSLEENEQICEVDQDDIDDVNQQIIDQITENSSSRGDVSQIAEDEDYGEDQYAELIKFDIYAWLESKGLLRQQNRDDNQQEILNSLDDLYAVPRLTQITKTGLVLLNFNSPIRPIDYDSLLTSYIIFGKQRRYLSNEKQSEFNPLRRRRL